MVVGTSHDTPDFAADNLVRWWQRDGLERYRDASELLVLADSGVSGGSNSPRIRCEHLLDLKELHGWLGDLTEYQLPKCMIGVGRNVETFDAVRKRSG